MFETAARVQQRGVTHGFLRGDSSLQRPVFASYHAPQQPVRDIGYVICPPHGWEGIQCYQSVQRLADELAAAGFHTLRVDYDGTGESLGSDEEPSRVAAWMESIRRAALALGEHVERVGLIGMRVGATLAGMVASELELANIVLWEACVSGAHYTREMEILASAAPSAIQAGRQERPGGIEAGGYLLTDATIASLNALDLMKVKPRGEVDVLLVQRNDRPPIFGKKLAEHLAREGCRVLLEQLPGHKEMMTYPERSVPATAILGRIRDWALERSKVASESGGEGQLALAEEAVEGSIRHRPVRLGPSRRLFGVLTEPIARGEGRAPVLILTGGVVPRTGVNRMNVVLASRLAALGHTVLRIDVSGICESAPAEFAAPNDPHAASLLEDVRGAVQLLLETTGHATVSLLGLCSGAYASFQTALADPRVRGVVLLNPEVFHLAEGSPKFSQTEQSQAAKHYRQSLFSRAAWKKLLSGKANVRYIVGFAAARAKTSVTSARDRLSARIKKVPQGLAGDFHRLLARDVKLTVVMADGDPGHESLMNQLATDLEALRRMGFELKITPGPDHTFNDFSVRLPLIDWLVEIMSR